MTRFRWVILAGVGVLCLASTVLSLLSITENIPTAAVLEPRPVIVLDPGHGGVDGGAVSDDGSIVEKDINLAISLTLRDLFLASGYEVVMTRETDISIHDEGITGVRQQKTSDLNNRLDLVNGYADAVFISIHQNKYGQASSWGTQVFYGPNNPESQRLATILQDGFIARLQPENHRTYKEAGKNLYLMYEANCPSVLVECGFLSNPEEAGKLTDPQYQAQIAFVIYGSVLQYLAPPAAEVAPPVAEVAPPVAEVAPPQTEITQSQEDSQ